MTFTNAHTHLELGWLAALCPHAPGRDFLPWWFDLEERRRKMSAMACFVETKFRQAAEAGIEALLAAGVTHVADLSASGSSIYPLNESGLQGMIFIEVTGQYAEQADRALAMARYVIDEARPKLHSGLQLGLALHAPYNVHPTLWKKGVTYAREAELPVCVHVAESRAEYDWMTTNTGPLADFYRETGIPLSSPGMSPVAYLEERGVLDLKPLLVHGVHVDESDVQRIAASGSRVVHCPRSNMRLHCERMPLELYLKHGVKVYLGTESLASSPSLDVSEEAQAAIDLHNGYVDAETILGLASQSLSGG